MRLTLDIFNPNRGIRQRIAETEENTRKLQRMGGQLDRIHDGIKTIKSQREAERQAFADERVVWQKTFEAERALWQETLDAVIETAIDRWNALPGGEDDAGYPGVTLPVWLGLTDEEYEAWRARRWDNLIQSRGSREREDPGA